MRLEGETALITGAVPGFGAEITHVFVTGYDIGAIWPFACVPRR